MSETATLEKIAELQATLTGNLLSDMDAQQEIYDLKKTLKPEIEENPELDDFDGECLSCGS